MENQGYPESDQDSLNDQGALANRQSAGFEPGNRDVLGENLQTDVSDVGARGGRATIGRTDAIEHGLGMAGQEAQRPGTGARQTRSDLPPGSYEASDELEESGGEMGGYVDQGIEQVGEDMGMRGNRLGASDIDQEGGNMDDVLWGVQEGTGQVGHGAEQTLGDELDATGATGSQIDDELTNRFSRNEAPMGENLQTSGEDMS